MIQAKTLDVGDATLYYEVLLRDPALVFLHGSTVNHTVFDHQRRHFHGLGAGSVAIDQRGEGKSSHLPDESSYSLGAYTGDLELVLDAEGIAAGTLVGHSMGSVIAQNFAAANPERVDALVLVSGTYASARNFARTPLSKFLLHLIPAMRMTMKGYNRFKGLTEHDRENHYHDFSEERFRTISDGDFAKELYAKNTPEYARAMCALSDAVMKWDIEQIAPGIVTPTLLIHGKDDGAVPVVTAYELAEMLPNAQAPVIIEGKHGIPFQQPELVNQAMERFLRGEIYSERLR
jgi:pimeloyl-ACP methyl ester carboxylesterase